MRLLSHIYLEGGRRGKRGGGERRRGEEDGRGGDDLEAREARMRVAVIPLDELLVEELEPPPLVVHPLKGSVTHTPGLKA